MKKSILVLMLVAITATPALAYVQMGHLPKARPDGEGPGGPTVRTDDLPVLPSGIPTTISGDNVPPRPLDDGPAQPVPEPGTMALASIGLIALGAAARRRRGV